MSYAETIRERQQHAIITSDPKLIDIGRDADKEIASLQEKIEKYEVNRLKVKKAVRQLDLYVVVQGF